jgi:hypothetical protein
VRDTLTFIAVLLIAILTVCLGAPPLINWENKRPQIDALVTDLLNKPFISEGQVAVRLLPSPRIAFERARIGDAADGIQVRGVETELSLTRLLRGDWHIAQGRAAYIRLSVHQDAAGQIRLPVSLESQANQNLPEQSFQDRSISLSDLFIDALIVSVTTPDGTAKAHTFRNLNAKADTLKGPWRIEGLWGENLPFRLASAAQGANGNIPFKFTGGGGAFPRFDVDGQWNNLIPSSSIDKISALSGTIRVAMGPPVQNANDAYPVPVSAQGTFSSQARGLIFDGVSIEAGTGRGTLRLGGNAFFDTINPSLDLKLEGKRFDLEGFLISPEAQFLVESFFLPSSTSASSLFFPVNVNVSVASMTLLDDEFSDFSLRAALTKEGMILENAAMHGPGRLSLSLTGQAGFAAGLNFSGRLSASAEDTTRLSRLISLLGAPNELTGQLDGRPAGIAADVSLALPVVSLHNVRANLGNLSLSGALRYTQPEQAGRGRFEAQIAANGLDLKQMPQLTGLSAGLGDADASLVLDAKAVRFGEEDSNTKGRITARIERKAGAISVDPVEIVDVAGANMRLAGRIAADGAGEIKGRLTATRAEPLLTLVASLWSGRSLLERIPSLILDSPVDLDVSAEGDTKSEGAAIRFLGTGARAALSGALSRRAGVWESITLKAQTQEARSWFQTAPLGEPASLILKGHGDQKNLIFDLKGGFADIQLETTEPLVADASTALLETGALRVSGSDIRPLLTTFAAGEALNKPVDGEVVMGFARDGRIPRIDVAGMLNRQAFTGKLVLNPASIPRASLYLDRLSAPWMISFLSGITWPEQAGATWSSDRFITARRPFETGEATLSVLQLDLGRDTFVRNAGFTLAVTPDGINLRNASAEMGFGTLFGELAITHQNGLTAISGDARVHNVPVGTLLGPVPFAGFSTGNLRIGGSGESPAALIAALAGGGDVKLQNITVTGLDPTAPIKAVPRLLSEADPLDARRQERVMTDELKRNPFVSEGATIPMALTGGIVRLNPIILGSKGGVWRGSATFDFRSSVRDVRGTLQTATLPAGWTGQPPTLGVVWRGPAGQLSRDLDLTGFSNGIAAITVKRELDSIEAYEASRRERQKREALRFRDQAPAATSATPQEPIEERKELPSLPPPMNIAPAPRIEADP